MKSSELFEQQVKSKKMDWVNDPDIGCFLANNPVKLYYGTSENRVKSVFENGIHADDTGYICCALEPYTANSQAMPLTESYDSDKRVVFVIEIPVSYSKTHPFYCESEKVLDKKLYESWGKSDVEFYALVNVEVPNHIPAKFVKGYMTKDDS